MLLLETYQIIIFKIEKKYINNFLLNFEFLFVHTLCFRYTSRSNPTKRVFNGFTNLKEHFNKTHPTRKSYRSIHHCMYIYI